jgi:hypothetical protein
VDASPAFGPELDVFSRVQSETPLGYPGSEWRSRGNQLGRAPTPLVDLPRDLDVAGDMPLELDQQIPRRDERATDEPTPLYFREREAVVRANVEDVNEPRQAAACSAVSARKGSR